MHALATRGHSVKTHAHILTALEQQIQYVSHQSDPRDISNVGPRHPRPHVRHRPARDILAQNQRDRQRVCVTERGECTVGAAKLCAVPIDGVFAALAV